MAKPIKFDEANATFVADGCGDLPAYEHGEEGDEQVITCWKLSGEELMEILQTGKVWLRVWGNAQPPVQVTGLYPFEDKSEEQPG